MSSPPWERLQTLSLSARQSRSVDQKAIDKYGMHSLVLMENAAIGCVQWLVHKFTVPKTTTILCGRGNNGGDGLAIARHLTNLGWPCTVILLGPITALSADAQANYRILTTCGGLGVHVAEEELNASHEQLLHQSSVVIDAMLGTGTEGAPRSPLDQWIEVANCSQAYRVAIDLPSGVGADDDPGVIAVSGTNCYFRADATLTFVSRKPAMDFSATSPLFGLIQVVPIGIPSQMMEELLIEFSDGSLEGAG